MGLYTTSTSLQILMIGTTFDSATTSLVQAVIDQAESEVNKYLSKRYDITSAYFNTTTSIPPVVRTITQWYSLGLSYQYMSRGSKEGMGRGKTFIDLAINDLQLISDYKLDLLASTGSVIPDMSQTSYRVMSNTTNYSNTFNEDDELKWAVDSDKLDDISTERE